jgi:hypothetical protein
MILAVNADLGLRKLQLSTRRRLLIGLTRYSELAVRSDRSACGQVSIYAGRQIRTKTVVYTAGSGHYFRCASKDGLLLT